MEEGAGNIQAEMMDMSLPIEEEQLDSCNQYLKVFVGTDEIVETDDDSIDTAMMPKLIHVEKNFVKQILGTLFIYTHKLAYTYNENEKI